MPRSIIPVPLCHRKACWGALPATELRPTTWPRSLIADAQLWLPPSVPRSIIPVPVCHTNACATLKPGKTIAPVWLVPTTCPSALMPSAQLNLPPRVPRSIGPLTTGAVTRDGSDRWRAIAGAVRALCSGAAPFPHARRLDANAIAETDVFIDCSTQRRCSRIPDANNSGRRFSARSLRSTAPSPACLLDPCPAVIQQGKVDFGMRSTNVNQVDRTSCLGESLQTAQVNTCSTASYNASWAWTMIWCNAGVLSRLVFVMMLANSAWIFARWPTKNRLSPPAIFRKLFFLVSLLNQ